MNSKWRMLGSMLMVLTFGLSFASAWVHLESSAYVGYGWNGVLPAFKGMDPEGEVSIPIVPTGLQAPTDYQGDFYVDEFTHEKLQQKWEELQTNNPEAAQKMADAVRGMVNSQFRVTGSVDPRGKIDPHGSVNLSDIRRPAFFGQAPYYEDIAKTENATYTLEFTVPRDTYERLELNETTPVKLRGWFMQGAGIPDGKGQRIHVLAILVAGLSVEITAIQHPDDPTYLYNNDNKTYAPVSYPSEERKTEKWGARQWRQYFYAFYEAGFDLLLMDKRGHGISGGMNGVNSGEMAEDQFRMLDQLESGEGMRILTPDGELLEGDLAAGVLLRGVPAKQVPIVVGGPSHGSMITSFVMQKNFVGWTAHNEPDAPYTPARGYNIKAGLPLADFAGGPGYLATTDWSSILRGEAAFRAVGKTIFLPDSDILANIAKWPAVFIGKGLWDQYQSTEGSFEVYRRATGLKELVFVRGPHSENEWGQENVAYVREKMVEFAIRAVVNPDDLYPEVKSLKEAVVSSPPYWEPSSRP